MSDVTAPKASFFSKKVGGIPVVYIAGVAAIALAFVAWRMNNNNIDDTDAEPVDDSATGDAGSEASYGNDDGTAYDGFNANPAPAYAQGIISPTTTVDTNAAWVKRGTEFAVAQGKSGGAAHLSLQKFVDGEQLSYDEGVIRDMVIKQFGAPPDEFTSGGTAAKPIVAKPVVTPVISKPPAVTPAPAKRQGNPPVTHTVKGKNDDALIELIRLYYKSNAVAGDPSDQYYDLIQSANPKLPKGGPYPVGTRVVIPAYRAPKYYTTTKTTNTAAEIAKKNGISVTAFLALNDRQGPFKAGTKVRVG